MRVQRLVPRGPVAAVAAAGRAHVGGAVVAVAAGGGGGAVGQQPLGVLQQGAQLDVEGVQPGSHLLGFFPLTCLNYFFTSIHRRQEKGKISLCAPPGNLEKVCVLRNPLPSSLSTLLVFRLRFPFLSLPLHYHHLLPSLRQGGAEEEELSAFPTPKSRIASSSDADHTAANFSSVPSFPRR